jgi:hypothetical protein
VSAVFIRFVIAEVDRESERELGLFQAVRNLRKAGRLFAHEERLHDSILRWFDENLERPTRFTNSKPPYYRKKSKAISWFKHSASQHIAMIRELAAVLENHGVHVRMLKSKRVGYVVYEDDHQVTAEPFADTKR